LALNAKTIIWIQALEMDVVVIWSKKKLPRWGWGKKLGIRSSWNFSNSIVTCWVKGKSFNLILFSWEVFNDSMNPYTQRRNMSSPYFTQPLAQCNLAKTSSLRDKKVVWLDTNGWSKALWDDSAVPIHMILS